MNVSGVSGFEPPSAASAACEGDLLEDGEKLLADAKALLECADRTIKTFKDSQPYEDIIMRHHLQQVKGLEEPQFEESTDDRGSTAGSAGSSSAAGITAGDLLMRKSNAAKPVRQKKGSSAINSPPNSSRKVGVRPPPKNLELRAGRRAERLSAPGSPTPPASTGTPVAGPEQVASPREMVSPRGRPREERLRREPLAPSSPREEP